MGNDENFYDSVLVPPKIEARRLDALRHPEHLFFLLTGNLIFGEGVAE